MFIIRASNGNVWSRCTEEPGYGLYHGNEAHLFPSRKEAEQVVLRIKRREAYKNLTITIEEKGE